MLTDVDPKSEGNTALAEYPESSEKVQAKIYKTSTGSYTHLLSNSLPTC